MQFISIVFLIMNTVFTMYLTGVQTLMNQRIPTLDYCPEIPITKDEAYHDYMKDYNDNPKEEAIGLMACYCNVETNLYTPWNLVPHNFEEFSADNLRDGIGVTDSTNYCGIFWGKMMLKELILFFISTSAVFINELVADFFQYLG